MIPELQDGVLPEGLHICAIESDGQLNQTRLAIADLEAALAALKRDVLPLNAERFRVMAEPVLDHLRELRQQLVS